jgi:hypothetical protein
MLDPNNVRTGTDIYEVTAGLVIHPFPDNRLGRGLVIRSEVRWDRTDESIIIESNSLNSFGQVTSTTTDNQLTFAVELIYAF